MPAQTIHDTFPLLINEAVAHGMAPWGRDTPAFVAECEREMPRSLRFLAAQTYASAPQLTSTPGSPQRWVLAAIVFAGTKSAKAPFGDALAAVRPDGDPLLTRLLSAGIAGRMQQAAYELNAAQTAYDTMGAQFPEALLWTLRQFVFPQGETAKALWKRAQDALAVRELVETLAVPNPFGALRNGSIALNRTDPGEVLAWFEFWAQLCGEERLRLGGRLTTKPESLKQLLARVREIAGMHHIPQRPIVVLVEEDEPRFIARTHVGVDTRYYFQIEVQHEPQGTRRNPYQLTVQWRFPNFGEYPVLDCFARRLTQSLAEPGAQFYS